MKKVTVLALSFVLLAGFALAGCNSGGEPGSGNTGGGAGTSQSGGVDRVFTVAELAGYNGKNGMPAYVAVDGIVYDVTDVPEWEDGEHNGLTAGRDLTDEITNMSPHGLSVLANLKIVGTLQDTGNAG